MEFHKIIIAEDLMIIIIIKGTPGVNSLVLLIQIVQHIAPRGLHMLLMIQVEIV